MSAVTLEHVTSFAVEQLWSPRKPASEHTALAHDFGVAGHDGKEFMEAYASRFDVDLSGFDWLRYFGPEVGGNPFGLLAYLYKRLVRGNPARQLVGLPEITLGHLVLCANLGKWQSPN
jgi:hypothetical protein